MSFELNGLKKINVNTYVI